MAASWQEWCNWVADGLRYCIPGVKQLREEVNQLKKDYRIMSEGMDKLKAAVDSYQADVKEKFATLSSAIDALKAQLASDANDTQAIADLTAQVTQAQSDLDGATSNTVSNSSN